MTVDWNVALLSLMQPVCSETSELRTMHSNKSGIMTKMSKLIVAMRNILIETSKNISIRKKDNKLSQKRPEQPKKLQWIADAKRVLPQTSGLTKTWAIA